MNNKKKKNISIEVKVRKRIGSEMVAGGGNFNKRVDGQKRRDQTRRAHGLTRGF